MKIDLYTKFILTCIAICLVLIAFRMLIPPARAEAQVMDVNIAQVSGTPIQNYTHYSIPVHISNQEARDAIPVVVLNYRRY